MHAQATLLLCVYTLRNAGRLLHSCHTTTLSIRRGRSLK